jgi:glycosyltransferase involved in cell wall biosynthesis
MMMSLGTYDINLYGVGPNEANVSVYYNLPVGRVEGMPNFCSNDPAFSNFNNAAIKALRPVIRRNDLLLIIGGLAQKPIADAFPNNKCIEFGIGYEGVFAPYRVFESVAWQHTIYGWQQGANGADGRINDVVIQNYFEVDDFPVCLSTEDYFVYLGRLIDRKGVRIACDTCREAGVTLKLAGAGDTSLITYGEYVGSVDTVQRGELLSHAKAILVPTQYVEPFGGVAVEAMLCGTPVIASAWGAFTETVKPYESGVLCRTPEDYLNGIRLAPMFNRSNVAEYARGRYGTDIVKYEYDAYLRWVDQQY